ncbi:MAG: MBL fold metallo-hydrolase [Candidatus Thermoplasmatota archaeon]|nr:MBL fold metallo-hydrolase [Candidatus Thermoplasmatota archaeon]
MTSLKLLKQGYVTGGSSSYRASSSCALIEDSGIKVLVDPGSSPDVPGMVERCDIIYLTHSHIDHYMNAGSIPHKAMMDRFYTFEGDRLTEHGLTIPDTDIEIIPTPGHSVDHSSLLIKTDQGRTLIAGDLFWWPDAAPAPATRKELLTLPDLFATDLKDLGRSRTAVLEKADIIIPGHGAPVNIQALR